jgi:hypothetical protein
MKNTIAFLAVCVVALLVAGYFLGWYNLVGVENNGGTHRLQIDVDTNKIRSDLDKGKKKVIEAYDKLKDSAGEEGEPPGKPDTTAKNDKEPFSFK